MSTKANKDAIDKRRQLVSQLRLRGLSVREIVNALAEARLVSTRTGGAWSIGTVQSDLDALTSQWRTDAAQDTSTLKGKTFGRLEEIIREAFREKDLGKALDAIKQERDMFGLDAPKQTQLGGIPGGDPILIAHDPLDGIDLDTLNNEELAELKTALATLAAVRARGSGGGEAQSA